MTNNKLTDSGKKNKPKLKEKNELTLVSRLADIALEKGIHSLKFEGIEIVMKQNFFKNTTKEVQSKDEADKKSKEMEEFQKLQDQVSLCDMGVNQ